MPSCWTDHNRYATEEGPPFRGEEHCLCLHGGILARGPSGMAKVSTVIDVLVQGEGGLAAILDNVCRSVVPVVDFAVFQQLADWVSESR